MFKVVFGNFCKNLLEIAALFGNLRPGIQQLLSLYSAICIRNFQICIQKLSQVHLETFNVVFVNSKQCICKLNLFSAARNNVFGI